MRDDKEKLSACRNRYYLRYVRLWLFFRRTFLLDGTLQPLLRSSFPNTAADLRKILVTKFKKGLAGALPGAFRSKAEKARAVRLMHAWLVPLFSPDSSIACSPIPQKGLGILYQRTRKYSICENQLLLPKELFGHRVPLEREEASLLEKLEYSSLVADSSGTSVLVQAAIPTSC